MSALASWLVPLLLVASPPPPISADVSGGAYLWLYAPWAGASSPDVQLWAAYVDLDVQKGQLRLHVEPRASFQKVRAYYPAPVWLQEGYLAWDEPWVTVKAGAVYDRFGRFWDDSFYGNLLFFDGLALDPGLGFSLEGESHATNGLGLEWAGQLLLRDIRASGALDGRDALHRQRQRRRDDRAATDRGGHACGQRPDRTGVTHGVRFAAAVLHPSQAAVPEGATVQVHGVQHAGQRVRVMRDGAVGEGLVRDRQLVRVEHQVQGRGVLPWSQEGPGVSPPPGSVRHGGPVRPVRQVLGFARLPADAPDVVTVRPQGRGHGEQLATGGTALGERRVVGDEADLHRRTTASAHTASRA
jgi:hypothetical protein